MIRYFLTALFLCICFSRVSYCQDNKIGADLDFRFGHCTEVDFRPKLESDFSSNTHGYFEGKLRRNFSDEVRNRYILNEGYFDFYLNDVDIRLGRQIISWGRADSFKPTDQFKIYDCTDFTRLDEEGDFSLKIDYFCLDLEMEGVGNLSSNQFGFRLNHEGEKIDYAVSYSTTYGRTPIFLRMPAASADSALNVLGFDWATFLFDYGLRGEMAYTFTRQYFQLVSGIDHTFDRVIGQVNIFVLAEYVLDEEQHDLKQGVVLSSEFKSDDTKKLNVKLVYNLEEKDYLFQPEFKFIPPQKAAGKTSKEIYVRADVLNGRDGTLFGSFKEDDKIEVGIKVFF